MANLPRKLREWTDEGLLTPEQAAAISLYEASLPASRWIYYSLLGLGAVIIGIGLISLVAANWGDIPGPLKLAAAFAGLLVLAHATWRRLDQGSETLLVIHQVAILACLGLISQVYHTGGRLEDALLFWTLITLPAATLARGRLVPWLWLTAFEGAGLFWLAESQWLSTRYRSETVIAVVFALPYLNGWLAWLLARRYGSEGGFAWAFGQLTVWAWLLVVLAADVMITGGGARYRDVYLLIPAMGLALVTVGALLNRSLPLGHLTRKVAMMAIVVQQGQALWAFVGRDTSFFSLVLVVILLVLSALVAGVHGHRRLFHFLVLVTGGRMFMAYLFAVGGLAATAFGLIMAGLLLLGAVHLWRVYREPLHRWLEGQS